MSIYLLAFLQNKFEIGSVEHILPVVFATAIAILFIRYSDTSLTNLQKQKVIHVFGCIVSISVVAFHINSILSGNYNFKTDLPFYLCSLMALIIPLFTYYRKYWMFEILLFWIIGGTLQAVITPDINGNFPNFDYLRYWIAHLGLLVIIFYFIFVFKMKPKLKSVFKSFLALQVYVVCMVIINYFLDANYFYLNEKPKSATLLDYFGEWPYYVLVCQLVIIPLFLIIYLPFYFSNKRIKSLSK